MLHYLHSDMLPLSQLPTISESTPYELPSPKDNDDVSNLINYYQLAQFLPTYQLKKRETLVNSLLDFSGTLSDLIDSLENGTPVLVGMQSNRGGHAVVFLKILSEDDNEYKISIYDPNYSTAQTLKLLKTPYVPASEEGPEGFLHVQYGTFNYIQCYIKASDLEHIDIRNYFGLSDNESYIDYDMPSISISPNSDIIFTSGDKTYYRTKMEKSFILILPSFLSLMNMQTKPVLQISISVFLLHFPPAQSNLILRHSTGQVIPISSSTALFSPSPPAARSL